MILVQECAIFSEDVDTAEDVGGSKRLKKKHPEDYERLVLRVEESKLELAKENEELQPDELVQVSFQGEQRSAPPGLVGNLLPFQVEGLSWMYHQEVHVDDIRGGVLADGACLWHFYFSAFQIIFLTLLVNDPFASLWGASLRGRDGYGACIAMFVAFFLRFSNCFSQIVFLTLLVNITCRRGKRSSRSASSWTTAPSCSIASLERNTHLRRPTCRNEFRKPSSGMVQSRNGRTKWK